MMEDGAENGFVSSAGAKPESRLGACGGGFGGIGMGLNGFDRGATQRGRRCITAYHFVSDKVTGRFEERESFAGTRTFSDSFGHR